MINLSTIKRNIDLIALAGAGAYAYYKLSKFHQHSKKQTEDQDAALRQLASSDPAFKNVLSVQIREPKANEPRYRGSSVYIGGNLVITAAHILSEKNIPYPHLLRDCTFNEVNEEGDIVKSYNPSVIYIHPEFLDERNVRCYFDIAVVRLEGEILLPGIPPALEPPSGYPMFKDAIAVGFPILAGPKDCFSYPYFLDMLSRESCLRRAVKVPFCAGFQLSEHLKIYYPLLLNVIGYEVLDKEKDSEALKIKSIEGHKEPKKDLIEKKEAFGEALEIKPRVKADILENGLNRGTSGGLLFCNGKHVAIPIQGNPKIFGDISKDAQKDFQSYPNRRTGEVDQFLPLYRHKDWLQGIFEKEHYQMTASAKVKVGA